MNLLALVDSLNKIGIVFFILTLVALIYEIRLFKKDQGGKVKPTIPEFEESKTDAHYTPITVQENQEVVKKANIIPIVLTGVFLLIFGALSIFGITKSQKKSINTPLIPQIKPQKPQSTLKSNGVSIFTDSWSVLADDQIATLPAGTKIYVGIETVKEAAVKKARIRVNEIQWKPEHETGDFNSERNVYYIPYTIQGTEQKILVEAQLQDKNGNWPK